MLNRENLSGSTWQVRRPKTPQIPVKNHSIPSRRVDMNRTEIEALIPHRDPFLWIDEVVEIGDGKIHARKKIEEELDVFRGHYPHFPILPGVLQLEAAFQAGAILIAKTQEVGEGQVPVVTRVNNTKFRTMVRPGDTLDIEVELIETVSNAFFLKGKVSVDGKVTVRLEFACAAARVE
jgi:3-hydroxyacyl-[acyl-carrier-protein] dehydratase